MTPQEEQLLNSLVDRVNQTQLQEKDPDAETLLNQRLAGNPDALYMLAQTVLVQNIALDQAKAQVNQLQQQVQQVQQHPQPAHATSFLGRLLGEHDEQAPRPQQQAPSPGYQPVPTQYATPAQAYPPYGAPQYGQPQYVPVGGQPSFLRGAMQTAAGVAAGALAFQGVESILHGFGGGYGMGGPGYGMGGFGMGGRPEETVINNYYDDPGRATGGAEHHVADQGAQFNDAGYDPQNNNTGDNLRGFDQNANDSNDQDTSAMADNFGDQAGLDDQSGFDDQNLDDNSGLDDSSGFDDGGGGFDDGGGGGF